MQIQQLQRARSQHPANGRSVPVLGASGTLGAQLRCSKAAQAHQHVAPRILGTSHLHTCYRPCSVVQNAAKPAQETSASVTQTVMVGDIGGTNARLSLWIAEGDHTTAELFAKTYPTASHATFAEVFEMFLSDCASSGPQPRAAALAIAGAVESNRCSMTNLDWLIDGPALQKKHGFRVALLNDFEAVGYGIPVLLPEDVLELTPHKPVPQAPKIVMGPGTGLGAAQLMWDEKRQDYKVWPGEMGHVPFAPRGWKQTALATFAATKTPGIVEVEQVMCGSGLELIYEFLLSDEPCNRQGLQMGGHHKKGAADITAAALAGTDGDPLANEAVDMLMGMVGAEAGSMALRCLAHGGVYVAGGITPRLLSRLTGGGALLEGFLGKTNRPKFADILATLPLVVIVNEKVGQIGARAVASKLVALDENDA